MEKSTAATCRHWLGTYVRYLYPATVPRFFLSPLKDRLIYLPDYYSREITNEFCFHIQTSFHFSSHKIQWRPDNSIAG